ncbi:hypothetical protein L6164_009205 [Bauhinia variegata]|uniref:Uncharacterized protein n=1 Tax=Bauhinia variegata TaxID=167791 RepID=A0ACB9PKF7_BAUVA|nr:hypothetical protein L6164_009205 [Bauhinia variegata]
MKGQLQLVREKRKAPNTEDIKCHKVKAEKAKKFGFIETGFFRSGLWRTYFELLKSYLNPEPSPFFCTLFKDFCMWFRKQALTLRGLQRPS